MTVLDRNDFRPQITVSPSSSINVPETATINTEIANFDATDNDTPNTDNSRVDFAIAGVNPSTGNGLFYINPFNGVLYLQNLFTTDVNRPSSYQ